MHLRPKTPFPLRPKEAPMQYKTIVLELLAQQPEFQERLRLKRTLLTTVEHYASELKTRHEGWKDCLSQATPASGPSQVASQALEIALQELRENSSLPGF